MAERDRRRMLGRIDKPAMGARGSQTSGDRGRNTGRKAGLARAVRLIDRICRVAGNPNLIEEARRRLARCGVRKAIRKHESPVLFEWLAEQFSYRGIANEVAFDYMERHGRVRARQVARALNAGPACPKLQSYWHFDGCGYRKSAQTCTEPAHFRRCPLPSHDLRNGGLNQTAYSLFLFIRDIASGDLVAWLDGRLAGVAASKPKDRAAALRATLLQPIVQISGVSSKVASMALATLLLAGDRRRPLWIEAGGVLIAIDTLVHNFFCRTGILSRLGTPHPYGARCYGAGGCAEVLDRIAAQIDARRFNPVFPANFPRFVQYAIWRFCATDELNECNGHQVDDRFRCTRRECPAFRLCDRLPLKPERKRTL